MMNVTSYYVKSEGIRLPDGTVFGAEECEAFRIVAESGIPGFLVYEVFGKDVVNVFGSGIRVDWKTMRDAINERISYQISIGNKILRGGEEIMEV